MAISVKLKALLTQKNIKYTVQKHPLAYTAQEIAAAQHVPGRQLAKCVLVKTDRGYHLVVLPAIHLIDLAKLKKLLKTKKLTIASEQEIKQQFPDIEVGAMSPFGNLYTLPTIVDKTLASADVIVFNAGSHTDTIKVRYSDFAKLAKPKVGVFGQHIAAARKTKKSVTPAPLRNRDDGK